MYHKIWFKGPKSLVTKNNSFSKRSVLFCVSQDQTAGDSLYSNLTTDRHQQIHCRFKQPVTGNCVDKVKTICTLYIIYFIIHPETALAVYNRVNRYIHN